MTLNRHQLARGAAKASGSLRYFTGKPCKHGHIAERQVSNGVCLVCSVTIGKKSRDKDPEKVRQRVRDYAKRNPEWRKRKHREHYQRHREEHLARCTDYVARNAEKVAAYKQHWKEENRDKVRSSHRNRKAMIRNSGSHTARDIAEILLMQGRKCGCCHTRISKKEYHVDHIAPLARGGSNGRENLQILCATCNLKKSKRDPIDFMRSMGRLL